MVRNGFASQDLVSERDECPTTFDLPAPELSPPKCSRLAVPCVWQVSLLRVRRYSQVNRLALRPRRRRSSVQRRLQGRGQRRRVRRHSQTRCPRGRRGWLPRRGSTADEDR